MRLQSWSTNAKLGWQFFCKTCVGFVEIKNFKNSDRDGYILQYAHIDFLTNRIFCFTETIRKKARLGQKFCMWKNQCAYCILITWTHKNITKIPVKCVLWKLKSCHIKYIKSTWLCNVLKRWKKTYWNSKIIKIFWLVWLKLFVLQLKDKIRVHRVHHLDSADRMQVRSWKK